MRLPLRALPRLALLLACLAWSLAQAWDAARILQTARTRALPAEAQQRVGALIDLVGRARGLPAERQIDAVNDFVNQRLQWVDDATLWGKVDHWASPLELLTKGAGDCEDLAMAKYFALVALGIPEAQLRLVYVRAQLDGRPQAHMVLAWYAQGSADPWILDNLNPRRLRASGRADLQPVFSFNAAGLWTGAGSTSAGNPLNRLTVWRDALQRAQEEGFAP
jgi:predicted transglutaminase-like cysteine proteinase